MHASLYSIVHLDGVVHLVRLVRQSESVPWSKFPMKTQMDPGLKNRSQINTFKGGYNSHQHELYCNKKDLLLQSTAKRIGLGVVNQ